MDKEKEKQDTEFYRSEIVRMISGVDDIKWLKLIYLFAKKLIE